MRYPAEILDSEEISRLIMASDNSSVGIRNRALVVLLYRSGLRISEALALKPGDLNPKAGTIRVLHGKGDKARTAGMDPGAFAYVDMWLARRSKLGFDGCKSLFCTLKGEPMWDCYVRSLMKRLARRAKIDKRVHAHGLRHLLAVEMAREGQPLTTIMTQLGHSKASTTATYLSRINPQEAIDNVRMRAWASPGKLGATA